MRAAARLAPLAVVLLFTCGAAFAQKVDPKKLQTVEYVQDTSTEIDGRVLTLMGGTTWILEQETIALPFQDVTVVFKPGSNVGTVFMEGEDVAAKLVDGIAIRKKGKLGVVVESLGEGALLRLNDDSLWKIPEYDRYDTGWWLPPYPVLLTSDEMYLINLKKGKRVWVER